MEPKALPSAKINPAKLLGGGSLSTTIKKISVKSLGGGEGSDSIILKKQVIQIKDLIKTNTLLKQQEENTKRKETEQKRFSEKEERLEKQEKPKGPNLKLPSLPKLGFLDRVKQFLFNLILGKIALALLPHLPKLTPIVSTIFTIQNNVIDWTGKILNGFITFVDKGYEAYDKSRNFLKNIGGENFTQAFDGFIGTIDKVIGASIIAAIAFSEFKSEDFGPDVKKGTKAATGAAGRGVISRIGRRAFVGTLGKGGARVVLKFVRPFLKRLPIIGALIDFGLSVALGENPGRAAFKAIGAGILGSIGAAVGAVGGPAAIAGGILGGLAGDFVGGVLYDLFFGNKKPTPSKVQGRAQGGAITRGGKLQTGPTRTIKKGPVRQVNPTPSQLQPGSDVGGEDKITKVFPKVEDGGKNRGVVNPLGYIEDVYKTTSKINYFGPLFGLVVKRLAGDKIDTVDYKNVGLSLNAWMNNTFSGEVLRTGGAFAGGGEVNAQMFMRGEDLSNVIAKSVEESVSSKLDKVIDDLEKQLMIKEMERKPGLEGKDQFGEDGTILEGTTGGEYGPILDLIASVEAVGGYDVVNGGKISGLSKMTISAARQAAMRSGRSGAMGRYQQMPQYVLDRARSIGLNPDRDLFSPENQDKLAILLINGAGYKKWKAGQMTTEQFAHNLSATWRGLPEGPNNKTYQDQYASRNKAHTSWANVMATLNAVKSGKIYGGQVGGGGIPLGTQMGSLNIARQIAENFGVPLFSHVRKGNPNSYHYDGRAMDFSNDAVGKGTPQQLALAKELVKRYGSTAKEIFYTPLGFSIKDGKKVSPIDASNHYDHVHVAFAKGGKVHGFTRAILGEKGPEFVIDADSTAALEQNVPGFLNALNRADYNGALAVLRNYASYEFGAGTQVVITEKMIPILFPMMTQSPSTAPVMSSGNYSGGSHHMDYSYKQG